MVKILLLSAILILIFVPATASWISRSMKRLDLVGGYTSIEVVSSTGIGTNSPKVYVRNLGPRRLSLGEEKPRDPSLWQVFIGNEFFRVLEVEELGKEDNLFEVYEIICLRLEGKQVKGSWKMVTVYGPGATLADPPSKVKSGLTGWLKGILSKGKKALSSVKETLKEAFSSVKEKAASFFLKAKEALSSAHKRFEDRFKGYGLRAEEGTKAVEAKKEAEGKESLTSKAKEKLKSAWSWLKKKAKSAWSWCKGHKKEIAIAGLVTAGVVIAILTFGAAIPALGSAAVGTKGAAIAGAVGASSYGTLSYAGAISLSLGESVLIGFAVCSALCGASQMLKKPVKLNLDELKPKGPLKPQIKGDLMESLRQLEKKSSFVPMNPEEQLALLEKLGPARPLEVDKGSQVPKITRVRRGRQTKRKKKGLHPKEGPRHREAVKRLYKIAKWYKESLQPAKGEKWGPVWKGGRKYGALPDYESKRFIWEAETSTASRSHILNHIRGRWDPKRRHKGGFKRYARRYNKGIVFVFDKKPSDKVIEVLIEHGFKARFGKVVWVWKPG